MMLPTLRTRRQPRIAPQLKGLPLEPLAEPMDMAMLRETIDDTGHVSGIVSISLDELIDHDRESVMERIGNKLVDSPLLSDIRYYVVGHQNEQTVLLRVSGDARDVLEVEGEPASPA